MKMLSYAIIISAIISVEHQTYSSSDSIPSSTFGRYELISLFLVPLYFGRWTALFNPFLGESSLALAHGFCRILILGMLSLSEHTGEP